MNALLAQFIPEARDLLERAGGGILAFESRPGDPALLNEVFRAVHTLKGSSGLFEIAPLTRLVHAAEDLLERARSGDMALDPEIIDGLLGSLDTVGRWIDALERSEALPDDAEGESGARAQALRRWLKPTAAPAPVAAVAKPRPAPHWLALWPEALRMRAFRAASGPLAAWRFDPEEDCFFRGDDPLAMARHAPGLLALRAFPREPLAPLEALDPLQCWLALEGVSEAAPETLDEHFRYVEERIEIAAIAPGDLAIPQGDKAQGPVFRDFAKAARGHLDKGDDAALARSTAALLRLVAPSSRQASALRWLEAYLETGDVSRKAEIAALIDAIGGAAPVTAPNLAERLALEQIEAWETPGPPELAEGRLAALRRTLESLFASRGEDPAPLHAALATLARGGDTGPLRALLDPASRHLRESGDPGGAHVVRPLGPRPRADDGKPPEPTGLPRVLRVDQAKVDAIVNLVAELIVAKNGLPYLADRAERDFAARQLSREIKDCYSVIDRITQGLQLGVMSVRMMPINQVLQRFPRLVRDVSRTLGKKVELVIEGEDTEADKTVLESLADPLIHIVRNSLDHGLETPPERLALGKPEQGTVRIAARNEADFVVIEVSDDGRGVDLSRVKAKAVRSGLIAAERAEQMSDAEAADLIFLPGFSTKDEVSDLSGRGVGMDVVRTTVEKAGGEVTLRNAPGRGASVVIRLPLTMAVTRIVTVDCCGRLYGIPMDLIAETVRLPRAQIRRVNNAEAFVLREAVAPLVRLADRLGHRESGEPREEEAVMVVKLRGELVGLVVDSFRERMETVVKPLSGILEGLPGFTGTALLGDGRVLLILDPAELL